MDQQVIAYLKSKSLSVISNEDIAIIDTEDGFVDAFITTN